MALSDGNITAFFIQKQGTNETQHIYLGGRQINVLRFICSLFLNEKVVIFPSESAIIVSLVKYPTIIKKRNNRD